MIKCFSGRDVLAISDFDREDILHILETAASFKREVCSSLKGKVLATCFFEPSTRTRLSFETAMQRLGGGVIGFSDKLSTSAVKGESLQDTMKIIEHYADIVVMRHPHEGAAQLAADSIGIPVINAGDGTHQHPTQTFLDLFTLLETQGKLDGLHIAMMGDLRHGRTVHSLAQGLIPFRPRLYFVSPGDLEMPKEICDELRDKGIKFSFHRNVEEILPKLDILYMTRIQEERFESKTDYDYCLKVNHLKGAKDHFKILHPLPRVNEIAKEVDDTPYAYYFEQAKNGVCVRQALLSLLLGESS